AGEHRDLRTLAKRLAYSGAFLGAGDKEPTRPRLGKRARNTPRTKAIGISLDHGPSLDVGSGQTVQCAPVGGDCVQVNGKGCSGHNVVLTGYLKRSRTKGLRAGGRAGLGGIEPPAPGADAACGEGAFYSGGAAY